MEEPENVESPTTHFAPGFTFVNVYELDQLFGGPEEDGWSVTTGSLVVSYQVGKDNAETVKAALEVKYPKGTGRNNCGSVYYQGGDYIVYIEDRPVADFPEVWPHYE